MPRRVPLDHLGHPLLQRLLHCLGLWIMAWTSIRAPRRRESVGKHVQHGLHRAGRFKRMRLEIPLRIVACATITGALAAATWMTTTGFYGRRCAPPRLIQARACSNWSAKGAASAGTRSDALARDSIDCACARPCCRRTTSAPNLGEQGGSFRPRHGALPDHRTCAHLQSHGSRGRSLHERRREGSGTQPPGGAPPRDGCGAATGATGRRTAVASQVVPPRQGHHRRRWAQPVRSSAGAAAGGRSETDVALPPPSCSIRAGERHELARCIPAQERHLEVMAGGCRCACESRLPVATGRKPRIDLRREARGELGQLLEVSPSASSPSGPGRVHRHNHVSGTTRASSRHTRTKVVPRSTARSATGTRAARLRPRPPWTRPKSTSRPPVRARWTRPPRDCVARRNAHHLIERALRVRMLPRRPRDERQAGAATWSPSASATRRSSRRCLGRNRFELEDLRPKDGGPGSCGARSSPSSKTTWAGGYLDRLQ